MAEWIRAFDSARVLYWFNVWAIAVLAVCVAVEAFKVLKPRGRLLNALEDAGRRHEVILVCLLTALAGAIRLFRLGSYPMGFNVDEASIAYDAWCMAEYGTDRHGVVNPAYLISWGSGQDVLYAWLLVPLYKLFGISVFTTRLPQAVLGTAAVPLLYLLLKKVAAQAAAPAAKQPAGVPPAQKAGGPEAAGSGATSQNNHAILTGLLGAALLAVSPWHIMGSRWSLIVYPLVPLLCAGLWFFLAAQKRPPLYLAAFACWALCLYAYLTSALFLLPFLAMLFLYYALGRRIQWKWFLIGAGVGLVIAFPIAWFVLVNNGLAPEIRTPLFSVVKLFIYRQDEVAGDIYHNANAIWELFAWQRPDWQNSFYDSVDIYGIVYLFSTPFALGGMFAVARRAWRNVRARAFSGETVWVFWLIAAMFAALMIHPNTFNRCIPLVLCYVVMTALGLRAVVLRLRTIQWVIVPLYAVAFALFCHSYFVTYAPDIGRAYNDTLMEAYTLADEVAGEKDIVVPQNVGFFGSQSTYPFVCLNRELSPEAFQAGYNRAPKEAYPGAVNMENYYLLAEPLAGTAPYGDSVVYVLDNLTDPVWDYEAAGFNVEIFRNYTVVWK